MRLNDLFSYVGSRRLGKRRGRGIGSGLGKTCGRGHKGQKSRSGGFHKIGFEGGQMPLQRRLPKFGFRSKNTALYDELRTGELNLIQGELVTISILRDYDLIRKNTKNVKLIFSGELNRSLHIKGLFFSKNAKLAVEKAGGSIER